jgi:superfamily II DNA or RNA helicase
VTKGIRAAALTDNTYLPKVADRLRAEIEGGAQSLDIVTGYIAPSAWAILGDALASVAHTRILLGKDYQLAPPSSDQQARDIRALVDQAIRDEGQPPALPTTSEAAAIHSALLFLRRDDVEMKVWTDGFLHAKAYILPQTVGVGSANFTAGGLVSNRELVAWREDRSVVDELAAWFRTYWTAEAAVDYKAKFIDALSRTTFGDHPYTPYEVLIRTLAERYGMERPPSLEAASFNLKWFQEDAVFQLIRMTNGPSRGALLADAVGLGKTYMALGVIHHYLYATTRGAGSGEPVLVIAPASLVPVWTALLRTHGLLWACRVITTQSLGADEDVRQYQGAGLVVIDEAHRLRGKGVWYRKALGILTAGAPDKRVLLVTATPVNTGIEDLTALLQVLTKNRRNVFAPAIADFESYLKRVERGEADPFPVLDRCIVRRSRTDILRDWEERRDAGMTGLEKPKLPERTLHHAIYRYVEAGHEDLFATFAQTLRGLRLAPYDLQPYERTAQQQLPIDDMGLPVHAPNSLAGLVAAGLLKRFESSLRAVALSLSRLDVLLRRFGEALDAEPPRLLDLSLSPAARALINEEREADDDEVGDFDARWDVLLTSMPALPRVNDYDLDSVKAGLASDRAAIAELRAALPAESNDGKVTAIRALFAPGGRLHKKRALLFTQFRDSAIYIHERLADQAWRESAGVGPVALVHGATPTATRQSVAASFDPSEVETVLMHRITGTDEPQILVSTDVLAEGHNLQLAEAVVNLDLNWNPQVAVQRAGRIDRLNSPHARVILASFLPEEGLDAHLGLIRALERRFHLIHLLGLGDEPVTRLQSDRQSVTFEQMRRLYADDVSVLDEIERTWTLGSTDFMRAPLEAFLSRHARETLKEIPLGVQSIKALPADWEHGPGVFIAFKYQEESLWRFHPWQEGAWGDAVLDETEMFRAIVCSEREPRQAWPLPFPGPGSVIDWPLLHRSATEVAEELTKRRATAALQRGASERSRRLRLQIREASELTGDVEELGVLLDRLEEVRVEDYDHSPDMRPFQDQLREARRSSSAGERHDLLLDAVRRGVALFGRPQGESAPDPEVVTARDLRLISWELLISRAPGRRPAAEQVRLDV